MSIFARYLLTELHTPVSEVVHSNNVVSKGLLQVSDEVTWRWRLHDLVQLTLHSIQNVFSMARQIQDL